MNEAVYSDVINDVAKFHFRLIEKRLNLLGQLIPAIQNNAEQNRERNRAESYNMNLFSFFEPGETTHSRLLAFFLDPNEAHGQGDLFLVEFLKLLEIAEPEKGRWIVTAEKGRIDVLIKRKHPHSVVIVENKSNFAVDQGNQLYRYWHQEIYKQQKEYNVSSHLVESPPQSHYQVIYLAPAYWKHPEGQSTQRPTALDQEQGLPSAVPAGIIRHLLFSEFVVQWLTNCLHSLPKDNHRLKEFTKQYSEFWRSA